MMCIFQRLAAQALWSLVVIIGCQSSALAYCASGGNRVSYEWIDEVTVNGVTNTSGPNGGYADFSASPIPVETGPIPITLRPGFRYGSYTEYWRIWIDLDHNQAFDANELVYSGSSRGTIATSVTIPSSTDPGVTGMRVSMRYGGQPPLCGSFTWGEVEDYRVAIAGGDSEPPLVTSVAPQGGAVDVPVNTAVMATFSEALDPAMDLSAAMAVFDGPSRLDGLYDLAGDTLTFVPSDLLRDDSLYTVELSTAITDLAGNPMSAPYGWSFTTAQAVDLTPPQVVSTEPLIGALDVAPNTTVSVTFSEPVDAFTVNGSSFTVDDGGTFVDGLVSHSESVAVFTPKQPLAYDTTYMVTLTTEITDLAGNPLEDFVAWSFSTGSAPDTTAPVVLNTLPANGEQNVTSTVQVTVQFSESMNAATLNTASFTLSAAAGPVAGTVIAGDTSASFVPDAALNLNETYTAQVSTAATDLAGNPLAFPVTWSFSTEPGYWIAGVVLAEGSGLADVTVGLSGASAQQTVTDAFGYFAFGQLLPGSYQVSATLAGYQLLPPSQPVTLIDSDITGLVFDATPVTTLAVPTEYPTIQQAVDAAAPGATIFVDDGVYPENVVVDKPVAIQSVNGYLSTAVVSTTGGNVFFVSAPDVTIHGFDVYGALTYGRAGIYFAPGSDGGMAIDNRCGFDSSNRNHSGIRIAGASNIVVSGLVCQVPSLYGIRAESTSNSEFVDSIIEQQGFGGVSISGGSGNLVNNNTVRYNRDGIRLFQSPGNIVSDNNCSNNDESGVEVDQSDSTSLQGNSCLLNLSTGISVDESPTPILTDNIVSDNGVTGMVIYQSDFATVSGNTCDGNDHIGLYLNDSSVATVTDNSCSLNGSRGIKLNFAHDNQLSGNSFNFNYRGVEFYGSTGNVFFGNETRSKVSGIKRCQIEMRASSDNHLFRNSFVSYTVDVCSNNGSSNLWQSDASLDYLFNGAPFTSVMGNYYSYGNPVDSDGDGVGDTPYALPGVEPADTHPLTNPIEDYLPQ